MMNQPTSPGFYYGVPFEDYSAWPAINFSLLKEMDKTPLHCQYRRQHPTEQTEEMRVGSATHCRILEPDKWNSRFYVCPPCKRNTAEGKAIYAAAVEAAKGRTIIRMEQDEDAASAVSMAESVLRHQLCGEMVRSSGQCEAVGLWFDELNEQWCKGRFDKLIGGPEYATILELKTTARIDDFHLGRQASNFNWHAQAAWYCWGHVCITGEAPRHRILAIESKPPFACRVVQLDDASMQSGAEKYARWYGEYCRCLKRGEWPGYSKEVENLSVPDFSQEVELIIGGKEYAL